MHTLFVDPRHPARLPHFPASLLDGSLPSCAPSPPFTFKFCVLVCSVYSLFGLGSKAKNMVMVVVVWGYSWELRFPSQIPFSHPHSSPVVTVHGLDCSFYRLPKPNFPFLRGISDYAPSFLAIPVFLIDWATWRDWVVNTVCICKSTSQGSSVSRQQACCVFMSCSWLQNGQKLTLYFALLIYL